MNKRDPFDAVLDEYEQEIEYSLPESWEDLPVALQKGLVTRTPSFFPAKQGIKF